MAKKKKVVRRAWTKDDLRLLKSMAKDKKGVTKIAKALKAKAPAKAPKKVGKPAKELADHTFTALLRNSRRHKNASSPPTNRIMRTPPMRKYPVTKFS